MITASHNPKNYNGIKIYDQNGGQLLPDESEHLSQYINAIEHPLQIDRDDFNLLLEDNKITYMSNEVTEAYKNEVKDLVGDILRNKLKSYLRVYMVRVYLWLLIYYQN